MRTRRTEPDPNSPGQWAHCSRPEHESRRNPQDMAGSPRDEAHESSKRRGYPSRWKQNVCDRSADYDHIMTILLNLNCGDGPPSNLIRMYVDLSYCTI